MKAEPLTLFLDRLRRGEEACLDESLTAEEAGLTEEEFQVTSPIVVSGTAYLAGDHVVIDISVRVTLTLPCKICGEEVEISLALGREPQMERADGHKSATFFALPIVRDWIRVEAPSVIECSGGECPQREDIKKFLQRKTEFHPLEDLGE